MKPIIIRDITKPLTEEPYINSLFGVNLAYPAKKPKVQYAITVWLIIFLPMLFLIGFNWITLVIPIGAGAYLGHLFSEPIWDGKTFLKFIMAKIFFYRTPKKIKNTKTNN